MLHHHNKNRIIKIIKNFLQHESLNICFIQKFLCLVLIFFLIFFKWNCSISERPDKWISTVYSFAITTVKITTTNFLHFLHNFYHINLLKCCFLHFLPACYVTLTRKLWSFVLNLWLWKYLFVQSCQVVVCCICSTLLCIWTFNHEWTVW